MPRIGTLISFLFIWLSTGLGTAVACSCPQPPGNVNLRDEDQIIAWKLERATNVVRGRILDVRAGQDVLRGGQRIVVAKMKAESVVKGEVPLGDLTLLTGFGTGDCGIASWLLVGIAWHRDMVLEVRRIPELPNEYMVDMCGYGEMTSYPR
jgi:hypothetical protein